MEKPIFTTGSSEKPVAILGCSLRLLSSTHPVKTSTSAPSFLFDLDGTLIDSVYQHIVAWHEALEEIGIQVPHWFIHRRVGMSGGLLLDAFQRETGRLLSPQEVQRLQTLHNEEYLKRSGQVKALPGAPELLQTLTRFGVPWAIATSGNRGPAEKSLQLLSLKKNVPLVTRNEVRHAKPDPDLFLAAAEKLEANIEHCIVVGDSIWDLLAAQRARALGVGLLSGGYGDDELMRAGAYRVYRDPADLLAHLDEVGVRGKPNRN
jgi:HAD superfamily hydrolase (TIGR01549 family)